MVLMQPIKLPICRLHPNGVPTRNQIRSQYIDATNFHRRVFQSTRLDVVNCRSILSLLYPHPIAVVAIHICAAGADFFQPVGSVVAVALAGSGSHIPRRIIRVAVALAVGAEAVGRGRSGGVRRVIQRQPREVTDVSPFVVAVAAAEGIGRRIGQPVVIVIQITGRVRRINIIRDFADAVVIDALPGVGVGRVIVVTVIHHAIRRVIHTIHHHAGRLVAIVVISHRQPPAVSVIQTLQRPAGAEADGVQHVG